MQTQPMGKSNSGPSNRDFGYGRLLLRAVLGSVMWAHSVCPTWGQDSAIPLYKRDPFDRITLNAANDNAVIDVFPITSLDRTQLPSTANTTSLVVRRLEDPSTQHYSVAGAHIARLEIFPFMLQEAAQKLIATGQLDEAFHYVARLKNDFAETPGLDVLAESFHFADARFLFQQQRYDEALLALDEVFRLNPDRAGLPRVLDRVLSEIITVEFDADRFASVRRKVQYARRQYGPATSETVKKWEQRLKEKATNETTQARALFENGNTAGALAAIRRARDIWPNLPQMEALSAEIQLKFPRVRVAVTQPFVPSPYRRDSSLNWAARRARPLVNREPISFADYTADGARYECRVGELSIEPDRRNFTISLAPEIDAYDWVRKLLRATDHRHTSFSSRWAEYLQTVFVASPQRIEVALNRPALFPETLLPQVELMSDLGSLRDSTDDANVFELAVPDFGQTTARVREIEEVMFPSPAEATNAMLAGDVDVIARVYPPDVPSLVASASTSVIPYRAPSLHALVFNDRIPIMRVSSFRRGILYAIDRDTFVRTEINGGSTPAVGRVLSGFAPIGTGDNDPLGYAYDSNLAPRPYDPAIAAVLLQLALSRSNKAAVDKGVLDEEPMETEEPESPADSGSAVEYPQLPDLVLAHPDSAIATVAAQSFVQNFRRVGISLRLRPLPAGTGWPRDKDWDVLYLETTIQEPLVDLPELVLGHRILGRHGGLVWQATRNLQESRTIEAARAQFMKIHRLIHDHTPLVPLWQIVEHAAVSKRVLGVSSLPSSIYENVLDWRFAK